MNAITSLSLSEQANLVKPKEELTAHIRVTKHLLEMLKLKKMSFELFDRISPPSLPPLVQEVSENLQKGATYFDQEQLGEGAFGVVYRTELDTMQLAKKIMIPGKAGPFFNPKKLVREAALLMALKHRNIVQIASLCSFPITTLVIKLVNRGSLFINLKKRDIYERANLMNILTGCAEGLKYLHGKNLTHGDFHWGNVVLHEQKPTSLEPVIIDLELASSSTVSHETEGNFIIKPPEILACNDQLLYRTRKKLSFRIPKTSEERHSIAKCKEYLRARPITSKIDIWAFGMIAFSLLSGGRHIYQMNRISTKHSVHDDCGPNNQLTKSLKFSSKSYLETSLLPLKTKQPLTKLGLPHEDPLTINLRDNLVSRCFLMDHEERPSSAELVSILRKIQCTEALKNKFRPIDSTET